MTITEYKLLLDYTISKHKYPPYTRQNEGLIYVGLPEIINFKSQNEKNCFVYYLCLFVAFDLKIYDKHRECYKTIKQLIGIPKFEYGLTSVFTMLSL